MVMREIHHDMASQSWGCTLFTSSHTPGTEADSTVQRSDAERRILETSVPPLAGGREGVSPVYGGHVAVCRAMGIHESEGKTLKSIETY